MKSVKIIVMGELKCKIVVKGFGVIKGVCVVIEVVGGLFVE